MITIGIDLGTTNSCVAFHDGKTNEVIDMADGRKTLPSVVSFMEDGEIIVGAGALDLLKKNTEFTFQHVKRLMGQPFRDNVNMGPQVTEGPDGMAWLRGRDRDYAPQEISALILKEMKQAAEERIGRKVDGAVIGVPAGFDPKQREATIEAAYLAGFKKGCVTVEEEPSAAAIAYGIDKEKYSTIAVFDMGGGTFDIAIMKAARGHYEPLNKSGHMRLGGINFDQEIAHWVVEKHRAESGVDLRVKPFAMTLLYEASETSKKTLSRRQKSDVVVRFAYTDAEGRPQHLSYEISKDEFEEMVEHLVSEALLICKQALETIDLRPAQIDHVILIGGMTRMPMVQEAVKAFFGRTPLKSINPDEAVAKGCAIKAAARDGRIAASHTDIVAKSFGIEAASGAFVPVIPRGSPHGTAKSIEVMTARDGQTLLAIGIFHGDELVAAENAKIAEYRHPVPAGHAGKSWLRLDWKVGDGGLLEVVAVDELSGAAPVMIIGGEP